MRLINEYIISTINSLNWSVNSKMHPVIKGFNGHLSFAVP